MTTTIDINSILAIIGLVSGVIGFVTFSWKAKKLAIDEGIRIAKIAELEKEVDHLYKRMDLLEEQQIKTDNMLISIQEKLTYIADTVRRLADKANCV